MNKFKRIYVILFLAVVGFFYASTTTAQSTVYFFSPSLGCFGDMECTLKQNGKVISDIRGPLKRITNFGPSKSYIYYPCCKKGVFKSEGKTLFAIDFKFTRIEGSVTNYAAEIQLNLTEGSVHYVKFTGKGFNDMQLKLLSQKEGEKRLKNKKYISLEEYIEE